MHKISKSKNNLKQHFAKKEKNIKRRLKNIENCMENVEFELNQEIDTSKLDFEEKFLALEVPKKMIGKLMKELNEHTLDRPKVKVVFEHHDNEKKATHKLMTLSEKYNSEESLPPQVQQLIKSEDSIGLDSVTLKSGYKNLTYNQALKKLLPEDITAPSGYEVIGEIAHLNLKEPQFPYKYLIGRVIFDKDAKVRTVVNKLEKLNNVYRTPILELIAGKHNFETEHLEGGLRFRLDFEKVYWCSRLHSERERVLKTLKNGEVICDAFCGIGPFALRAAKEAKSRVFASDLNPECFKYLKENIKINKLGDLVTPDCKDARVFIYETLEASFKGEIEKIDHFYMNLPADGLEFLDVFPKFFTENSHYLNQWDLYGGGLVHVYCFVTQSDHQGRLRQVVDRVSKVMPGVKEEDVEGIHSLKTVSSEKEMLCVSLRLTKENCSKVGVVEEVLLKKRAELEENEQKEDASGGEEENGDEGIEAGGVSSKKLKD